MAKQYALKGYQPGPFVAGILGTYDTRRMDDETAQRLIRHGIPLIEITLVVTPKKKTDSELPKSEVIEDPQSEKSTT